MPERQKKFRIKGNKIKKNNCPRYDTSPLVHDWGERKRKRERKREREVRRSAYGGGGRESGKSGTKI